MANFKESMKLLTFLEYSNNNSKLLHKNKNEDGLTFYGIYESANPLWVGWYAIKKQLKTTPNLKECSLILSKNIGLMNLANDLIKKQYWDKAKLDLVNSQKIANEIFIFGFNVGMPIAIKKAQKLIGVNDDGDVGNITLKALNSFNENNFDVEFDELEIEYYKATIERKPYLKPNEKGWFKRALFAYNNVQIDTVIV